MDARVAVDPIFDAFGVPATVTRPGEDAIETTAVWVPAGGTDRWGARDETNSEILRARPRKVIALRGDEIVAAPVGTIILAPEEAGGTIKTWRVDELDHIEHDLIRVFVQQMGTADLMEAWKS